MGECLARPRPARTIRPGLRRCGRARPGERRARPRIKIPAARQGIPGLPRRRRVDTPEWATRARGDRIGKPAMPNPPSSTPARPAIFWLATLILLVAAAVLLRDVLLPFVAGVGVSYFLVPLVYCLL